MNLEKLKVGDIVRLDANELILFEIVTIDNDLTYYPIEGKSLTPNNWPGGVLEDWTIDGCYSRLDTSTNYNIVEIITKEENPEYWL